MLYSIAFALRKDKKKIKSGPFKYSKLDPKNERKEAYIPCVIYRSIHMD